MSKYIDGINEEAMDTWIKALRSGEYLQARNVLANVGGLCCLGVQAVLCGIQKPQEGEYGLEWEDKSYEHLPPKWTVDKLNLPEKYVGNPTNVTGTVYVDATQEETDSLLSEGGRTAVTVLNDSLHLSFNEIADRLEATFLRKD
jgi:hypothetical protein